MWFYMAIFVFSVDSLWLYFCSFGFCTVFIGFHRPSYGFVWVLYGIVWFCRLLLRFYLVLHGFLISFPYGPLRP